MLVRKPSLAQVGVIVGFALSCFGLMVFLWVAFGGPIPLKPEGYRIKVPFDEATSLAVESDVRISNVSVGKVKSLELDDEGEDVGTATATLEIDSSYAPIPEDTRAILRSKTLLGETYVELTPGDGEGPTLPEGDTLPRAQVADSVQLDEIFRTFDPRTRAAFQTWMQEAAVSLNGRGADLNAALGNLDVWAQDATRLLRVLDTQQGATSQFIRNTGVVFNALSERQGQLQGLIRNSKAVFETTARRDQELREIFTIFPTFLRESRLTLERTEQFAKNTDPLVLQFTPAARELSGALVQLGRLSPVLEGFFRSFRDAALAGRPGFPALQRLLNRDLPPFLSEFTPFFKEVTPILAALQRYRRETTSFLANVASATNGAQQSSETNGQFFKYLRTVSPLNPESLAAYPNARLTSNRGNAYMAPGGYLPLPLRSFETRFCTNPPGTDANYPAVDPGFPPNLFTNLKFYAFGGFDSTSDPNFPKPPCIQQGQQPSIGSIQESTFYPHVYANP